MKPIRSTRAHWARFGDEIVVYQAEHRQMHRLNRTGAAIWAALDGALDVRGIAAELGADYGHGPQDLLADVEAALATWADLDLLNDVGATQVGSAARPNDFREPLRTESTEPLLEAAVWAAELGPFQGFGFEFTVRVDDQELARYLEQTLRSLKATEGGCAVRRRAQYWMRVSSPGPILSPGEPYEMYLDGQRIRSSGSVAASADYLLWHINRMAIDGQADHVLFHAAGVASRGQGILVPGQPDAGKSTLATGLVKSGLEYLSDEAVAIDLATNELVPFPKAIGIDPGSQGVFSRYKPGAGSLAERYQVDRWQLSPDDVRHGSVSPRVPLDWIIATEYQAGAPTSINPIAPIDAMAVLLGQTFGLGNRVGAFTALASLVKRTPAFQLISGDLDQAVSAVRGVIGAAV